MKPASFEYHRPTTLEEAVKALAEYAPQDGRILSGGQSLVPTMAFRMAKPAHLIDINGVRELADIRVTEDALIIGAGVRHAAFHKSVVDGVLGQLLSFVVRHIAHYPIRQRGTFCGSLAHADPSSEWCLVSATLDAEITATSVRGARTIAVAEFIEWAMSTTLAEDEILTSVRLPLLTDNTHFGFYEFSRRAGDYALAMSLVTYELADGVIAAPRVGIGGVEGVPRRIAEAEEVLLGQKPSPDLFRAAAEAVANVADPMSDMQASANYRRDLARTVVRRALERSLP
ncbi:MAG TPA: FAD binding domain-containing protein [Pseudolabrys sp.]|nr:FAD binding domain-containing protein [Pseudolabrys sp.]